MRLRPAQLPALTSLRFFAAVLVVLFHYLPRDEADNAWWIRIINHGYAGVSFFFVLSGFILAYTGVNTDFHCRYERRAFYARRMARIYPAFLLATLLDWPLFAWFQYATLPVTDCVLRVLLVTCVTLALVQSWLPWSLGQLNAPGWTIGVEMFLYASLPRLMNAYRALGSSGRWWCVAVAVGLCWVPAIIAPWTEHWFPDSQWLPNWLHSPYPASATWINCFPPFHLPQFFVGMAVGCWVAGRTDHRPNAKFTGLAVMSVLTFCVLVLAVPRGAWPLIDIAINHGALASAFAVLFAAIALTPQAPWLKPLGWKPLVLLGDASYALYIFQMPVMKWVSLAFQKTGIHELPMLIFTTGFVMLIAVSLISWKFEQWARPRLASWLTQRLRGHAA